MTAKFGLLIDAKTKGEGNIKRLGNSMQGVAGKAKNLGVAVQGAGLAFKAFLATAAVGGILAIGKSAIDTADSFGKLSTRTGIAADKLLAYVNAGKLADVSQKDLETGLRTLARTQVEASEGVKTYAEAYAKLGVSVKNADGSLKPSDQLIGEISDKFQKLPDGPEKAAVAMDIFGRSGQKMITMLNGGQESLERFGYELSTNFARNSERFNDQLTEMGIEMERLQLQVMDELLPTLIDLADVFIDITKATSGAITAFARFFNIGDKAVLEDNTLKIQAINKALYQYGRTLKGLRAETSFNPARAGVIRNIEGTVAELERKRDKLRAEINRITRVDPVTTKPEREFDFVRTETEAKTRSRSRARDKDLVKTKEIVQATDEMRRLLLEINAARVDGNEFRLAGLEFDRALLEIQEQNLQGNNKLIAQSEAITAYDLARQNLLSGSVEKTKELNKETSKTEELFKSIKDTVATGLANAIEGLIDGTKTLSESLSSVLRQVGTMLLQFGARSLLGGLFPSAKGNVFASNKIVPFAYGGVVNKPTLFPMANGMGLMGEAGPEAVMPLRRGRGGRLGVEAAGGVGNVVVNVDATGSRVQGDQPNAKALGSVIGAAVQAELIKQKRPGGILS